MKFTDLDLDLKRELLTNSRIALIAIDVLSNATKLPYKTCRALLIKSAGESIDVMTDEQVEQQIQKIQEICERR